MSKPVAPHGPAAAASSVDDVLALVRARGGRATASRRTLLEVLFDATGHVTAEDLAAAVHAQLPDVHLSTIYRNLDELQRLGVVVHSHLGHGPAVYQLAAGAHAHFLCEQCGAVINAPEEMFRGLARRASSELGFAVDLRHFAVPGRCAHCS